MITLEDYIQYCKAHNVLIYSASFWEIWEVVCEFAQKCQDKNMHFQVPEFWKFWEEVVEMAKKEYEKKNGGEEKCLGAEMQKTCN